MSFIYKLVSVVWMFCTFKKNDVLEYNLHYNALRAIRLYLQSGSDECVCRDVVNKLVESICSASKIKVIQFTIVSYHETLKYIDNIGLRWRHS